MVGSSLYEESMRKNDIDIPVPIINFFKKLGKYIPPLHKGSQTIKLSYDSTEGYNAIAIPKEYSNYDELMRTTEEYPLENVDIISE